MPVAEFPTPSIGGPTINVLQKLPTEYPSATSKEFKDGGASYGLSNANGVQKWSLSYDGLTTAEAATLDNHYNSANGIYGGFNFRDPRTATLYTDVHYVSFEAPTHKRIIIQSRRIVLVKRPI